MVADLKKAGTWDDKTWTDNYKWTENLPVNPFTTGIDETKGAGSKGASWFNQHGLRRPTKEQFERYRKAGVVRGYDHYAWAWLCEPTHEGHLQNLPLTVLSEKLQSALYDRTKLGKFVNYLYCDGSEYGPRATEASKFLLALYVSAETQCNQMLIRLANESFQRFLEERIMMERESNRYASVITQRYIMRKNDRFSRMSANREKDLHPAQHLANRMVLWDDELYHIYEFNPERVEYEVQKLRARAESLDAPLATRRNLMGPQPRVVITGQDQREAARAMRGFGDNQKWVYEKEANTGSPYSTDSDDDVEVIPSKRPKTGDVYSNSGVPKYKRLTSGSRRNEDHHMRKSAAELRRKFREANPEVGNASDDSVEEVTSDARDSARSSQTAHDMTTSTTSGQHNMEGQRQRALLTPPQSEPQQAPPPPPPRHSAPQPMPPTHYWNATNTWYQGMPCSQPPVPATQPQAPAPLFLHREQSAFMNVPPTYNAQYGPYPHPPAWQYEAPPPPAAGGQGPSAWSTAADPATPPNSEHMTLSMRGTPQSGNTVILTSTPEGEGPPPPGTARRRNE